MEREPLIIAGDEQSRVRSDLADAGLPPAVGVQSFQVFRASRDVPEICDGKGWTYHHHVDMACWKGRLYVAWNTCERDEDVWPSRELYSTSEDGAIWAAPEELFPQGISTCLRMYFYLAANGRMLVIAGLRRDFSDTDEDTKGALVVREITADHHMGDVFLLQPLHDPRLLHYSASHDAEFVKACQFLLADTVYLEQQDRGKLLGDRRMKWHDAANWPSGKVPGDDDKWVSGKAFTFFRREDEIVGISKMGWTTVSRDDGRTWAQPTVPPTLVTGKAKVWSQWTSDGRCALVYNPSTRQRFPLIVATSADGRTFDHMRIVQGELPIQRYAGKFRSIGPQYTRGMSLWSNDGSRDDHAMWVVYSMSKEDIWVSRIPLPVKADATSFDEPWNTYQPNWGKVGIENGAMVVESTDPYDYATATRIFPETPAVNLQLQVRVAAVHRPIEIDLLSRFGSQRVVALRLSPDGGISAKSGETFSACGGYSPGDWLNIALSVDIRQKMFEFILNQSPAISLPLSAPADSLHRITFHTGEHRNIGGQNPVPPGTDRPVIPTRLEIREVRIAAQR